MAMNRVQFQRGLSLAEFFERYGSEAQCQAALERVRWPDGFVCPRCGGTKFSRVTTRTQPLFQCTACRHQTSLIAGTVMQASKLALRQWFAAIYLIGQAKSGISALALSRQVGVSYPSAWLMHHKLMQAMAVREQRYVLCGLVQLDDAYLGGERTGGKRGRGSQNKVPFVAALSLDAGGRPRHARFSPVQGFTLQAIERWARGNLAADAAVRSDGLACFTAVTAAGCRHEVTVVAGRKPQEVPQLRWINTVLGNLKMGLSGSFHAFDFEKYARRYLAAFAWRFNRRFNMRALTERLLVAAAACPPQPLRVIRVAEHSC